MRSLYHILEEHLILQERLLECEGELTPELESALALTEEDLKVKAVSYGYVIKSFEDDAEAIDKEIKRLTALQERRKKNANRLKEAIKGAMQRFKIDKIELNNLTLSFRKSESVDITGIVHPKYCRLIPSQYVPDKALIKAAFKEGKQPRGAKLVENQNLQIK